MHFAFSAAVDLSEDDRSRAIDRGSQAVEALIPDRFDWPEPGLEPLRHRPVIIGAGPAGLYAGYLLAHLRISAVDPRARPGRQGTRRRRPPLRPTRPARPREQLPLRRGGAGTFSDGKLTSRSAGPDVTRVLEILAECHGGPSIVYEHRPHLGSNRLPLVVKTLRRKFEVAGGEIRFSCRVEDFDIGEGRLRGLGTSSGFIPADLAVLAIGHSARDTYGVLLRRGVPMEAKPFQLGVRIEQPQAANGPRAYGAGWPSVLWRRRIHGLCARPAAAISLLSACAPAAT